MASPYLCKAGFGSAEYTTRYYIKMSQYLAPAVSSSLNVILMLIWAAAPFSRECCLMISVEWQPFQAKLVQVRVASIAEREDSKVKILVDEGLNPELANAFLSITPFKVHLSFEAFL